MINSDIKIFKSKDGETEVQVKLDNDTVWLNQYQLEDLFKLTEHQLIDTSEIFTNQMN